jgi:prepilin-type N-terminal cleavage/methylation domain-containing protein
MGKGPGYGMIFARRFPNRNFQGIWATVERGNGRGKMSNQKGFTSPAIRCFGRHGFTVIEMLMVVSIVGIICLIAAPDLGRLAPNYRMKGAVRTVFSDVQFCKMRAVSMSAQCRMLFLSGTSSGTSYKLQYYNPSTSSWVDMLGDKVRDFGNPSNAFYYSGVTFTPTVSEINFQPWGAVTSATIVLVNSAKTVTLSVSTNGKITCTGC